MTNILSRCLAVIFACIVLYGCVIYKTKYKVMKYKLDFYTQYNQFTICDSKYLTEPNSAKFETVEAITDRMGVEEDQIRVGIECYGHVKGELEFLENANTSINYSLYNHIVEGGFETKSGIIQLQDCPNSFVELGVKVKPGRYRVRVYSSNLKGFDTDEDEGDDFYKIEIWPDISMDRRVLKRLIQLDDR